MTFYSFPIGKLIDSIKTNQPILLTNELIKLLKNHRLLPYFLQNNLCEKTENMKLFFQENSKKNFKFFNKILELNEAFYKKNINFNILKGVVLSKQIYNDIGSRECRDIDLLIEEKNTNVVHDILLKQNFHLRESNKLQNKTYQKYFHHVSYLNSNEKIMIELHWRPFSIESFFPENDFSKISKKVIVSNQEISVLNNEYNLIYLCIHGSLHMFSELIWILDIAKFIKTQEIDWNKIQQISKLWRIERPISMSIFLASFLCNATIPNEYKNPDKKTKKLINLVLRQLPNEKRNLAYRIKKLIYFINLKDGFIYKWNNIKYRFFRALIQ
ncbi:MAG: hypothetical protein A2033_08215 [Bacteroidetes bacterium GWA2_31_9]|nr:MAG: hypothetical protein A2033_08215 [Bacteroidetes bacterium GWA2_31_9]